MNKARYVYSSLFVLILTSIFAFLYYGGGGVKVGYISDIKIDINSTIALYNKNNTIQKDSKNFETQKDIFNDSKITEYVYSFKIDTRDKIFRKSDIFNIYPTFDNLPDSITNIYMKDKGGKYGNFISNEIINFKSISNSIELNRIEPIQYTLKMTKKIIIWFVALIVLVPLIIVRFHSIKTCMLNIENRISISLEKQQDNVIFLPHSNKLSYIAFYAYIAFIGVILISQYLMMSVNGDDWEFGSTYLSFYEPYKTSHHWQRGRHFVDILLSLNMRPFGEILASFGIDPLLASNIVASFFILLFYFVLFFSCSLFIWILNNKNNFKMIFVVVSLSILLIVKQMMHFTVVGAYIGTAGISLLVWLPIIYYLFYNKVIYFSSNQFLSVGILIFFIYSASFVTETSSLPMLGLSIFVLLYMIYEHKFKQIKHSISIYYYIALFLILVPTAFILTMKSGRGEAQVKDIAGTSYMKNALETIGNFSYFGKWVIILGFIYFIFLGIKGIKNKYFSKKDYIRISTLFVALLGVVGFACIKVPGIWFEAILISLVLFSFVLDVIKNNSLIFKTICSFLLVSFIVCGVLKVISTYEENFEKYFHDNAQRTLVNLFLEAEKNGDDKIILTREETKKHGIDSQYSHGFYLGLISAWMQKYYTKNYIKIKIIDSNDNNE